MRQHGLRSVSRRMYSGSCKRKQDGKNSTSNSLKRPRNYTWMHLFTIGGDSTVCKPLCFGQQNEGRLPPRHLRRADKVVRIIVALSTPICLTEQDFPRAASDGGERRARPPAGLRRGLPRRTFSSLFPSPPIQISFAREPISSIEGRRRSFLILSFGWSAGVESSPPCVPTRKGEVASQLSVDNLAAGTAV